MVVVVPGKIFILRFEGGFVLDKAVKRGFLFKLGRQLQLGGSCGQIEKSGRRNFPKIVLVSGVQK